MIASMVHFAGFALFLTAASFIIYRHKHVEEGLGEFSVGLSYRDFYTVLTVMVPLIAAASYFFISLGLGSMSVGGREVVWLRYFEWSITTPILVLGVIMLTQLTALAGLLMVLDFIMILTGFIATVTAGTIKQMAFIASSFVFVLLMYLMMKKATQAADERPGKTKKLFRRLRNFLLIVWSAYPFVWVLSTDGYALVGFTMSSAMYLVLDVVAKIGFAFLVITSFDQLDSVDIDVDGWEPA